MPPRKRTLTHDEEQAAAQKYIEGAEMEKPESFLKEGAIVNLVSGGRTLQGYEVLGWDGQFVKFRGNIHVAPQTEIVLIPFQRIEAIGLTDER